MKHQNWVLKNGRVTVRRNFANIQWCFYLQQILAFTWEQLLSCVWGFFVCLFVFPFSSSPHHPCFSLSPPPPHSFFLRSEVSMARESCWGFLVGAQLFLHGNLELVLFRAAFGQGFPTPSLFWAFPVSHFEELSPDPTCSKEEDTS